MPPDTAPHLEEPDLQEEKNVASDRMRASAVRASEVRPVLDRISQARRLMLQLRGFIASHKLDMPAEVDQEVFTWLHQDAMARKEQQE